MFEDIDKIIETNRFVDDTAIEVESLRVYNAGKPYRVLNNDSLLDAVVGVALNGVDYWFYGMGEANTEYDGADTVSRRTTVLEFKPLHPTEDLYINELYMLVDKNGIVASTGEEEHEYWFAGAHLGGAILRPVRTVYPLSVAPDVVDLPKDAEAVIFHMLDVRAEELRRRRSRRPETPPESGRRKKAFSPLHRMLFKEFEKQK
ncbi:MAG: hypothetical protein RRC34_16610 [Lentisphaeria bacterium]|nr:hypothetical protein [Lentisphaeria bacterium]